MSYSLVEGLGRAAKASRAPILETSVRMGTPTTTGKSQRSKNAVWSMSKQPISDLWMVGGCMSVSLSKQRTKQQTGSAVTAYKGRTDYSDTGTLQARHGSAQKSGKLPRASYSHPVR